MGGVVSEGDAGRGADAGAGANGSWWESGPIFSVRRRRTGITTLPPGETPGRFTPALGLRALVTALFWTGGGYLVLPRFFSGSVAPWAEEMTSRWWWYALVVLGVLMMMLVGTFGLYTRAQRRFGQQRVPIIATAAAVALGFCVAGAIHLRHAAAYFAARPEETPEYVSAHVEVLLVVTLIAGAVFVGATLYLPVVVHQATGEQREIARIRAVGTRYPGTLVRVDFRNERIDDLSQFTVTARCLTPGGARDIVARMASRPSRVPLPGAPVSVIIVPEAEIAPETAGSDGSGVPNGRNGRDGRNRRNRRGILVEPDPERRMPFDPDIHRYTVYADGGS